jgi:hypothetical protein
MAIGKDAWGTPFVAKGKDDRWMAKGKGAWSSPFDDWKGDAGMKKGDAGWLGAREGWNDKSREHVAYKGKGRRDSWNSFEKQDLRMNPDPRANRDPRTNPEAPPPKKPEAQPKSARIIAQTNDANVPEDHARHEPKLNTEQPGDELVDGEKIPCRRTHNEIIAAAKRGRATLMTLLIKICDTKRQLDLFNVSALLHRSAKLSMSLPSPIICFVVETLNGIDHHLARELDAKAFGKTLYGLRCMSDSEETRQLVSALIPKVEQWNGTLDGVAVGNALFGLQNIFDSDETRELVATLTPKVELCCDVLSEQVVDKALYGMQNMGNSKERRQLVAALIKKLQDSDNVVAPLYSPVTATI